MGAVEGLGACAAALREGLRASADLTRDASALLDGCSGRLRDLDRGVAPLNARTLRLTRARDGIAVALQRTEEVLHHLDCSRKVGARSGGGTGMGRKNTD